MRICLFFTLLLSFSALKAQKVGPSSDTSITYRAIKTADWEQYSEGLQAVFLETRDSIRACYQNYEGVAKGFSIITREQSAGRSKEEMQLSEVEQDALDIDEEEKSRLDKFTKELVSILFMEMGAKTYSHKTEVLGHLKAIYTLEGEAAKQAAPLFILKNVIYTLEEGEHPADEPLSYILKAIAQKWT